MITANDSLRDIYNLAVANGYVGAPTMSALLAWNGWDTDLSSLTRRSDFNGVDIAPSGPALNGGANINFNMVLNFDSTIFFSSIQIITLDGSFSPIDTQNFAGPFFDGDDITYTFVDPAANPRALQATISGAQNASSDPSNGFPFFDYADATQSFNSNNGAAPSSETGFMTSGTGNLAIDWGAGTNELTIVTPFDISDI